MAREASACLENLVLGTSFLGFRWFNIYIAKDTSKQIAAGVVLHFLNIATAYLLSEEGSDPCAWYVVTVCFDTSIGMLSCCLILSAADHLFERTGKTHLKSGNYFKEVSVQDASTLNVERKITIDTKAWTLQLLIWLSIVVLSKGIQFIVQSFLRSPLNNLSSWLLSGLDDLPTVKLIISLFVIPLLLTALQFWVVDNFIKKRKFDHNEVRLLKDQFFEELDESMAEIDIEIGSIPDLTSNHKAQSEDSVQSTHSSSKFYDEPEISTVSMSMS